MTDTQQTTAPPAKEPAGKEAIFTPVMIDLFAGVSSVAAGAVTAWRLIEERAHKNLSSMHYTDDIKDERKRWGIELRRKVKHNEITPQEAYRELSNGVMHFEKKMDKRFAKAGVSSVWDRLGILRGHQKWEVAITALAVTGVALGSILLVGKDMLLHKDKSPDENGPQR